MINLNRKKTVMSGYWQSWSLPDKDELPLTQVPELYTEVIIAFIAPDEEGELIFTGPNVPTYEDVYRLKSRGQKVLLSIGGGGVTVTLDKPAMVCRFSESLYEWIHRLGVDGIDIDVEAGMEAPENVNKPEGTMHGLISGLESVFNALTSNMLLTFAPETLNLVGGIEQYGGNWGNYIPLINHFGDRVSRVHMQYYNSGPMRGLDGLLYEPGTVEFITAMTEALIEGFEIAGTGERFKGLPQNKVSIGLPAVPEAAFNGYLNCREVNRALRVLRSGHRGINQPAARPYPYLGGLMTWSVQWDATNNFNFAKRCGRFNSC